MMSLEELWHTSLAQCFLISLTTPLCLWLWWSVFKNTALIMRMLSRLSIDDAAYIKKAYIVALNYLFPNSAHVTCQAHIKNLIGGAFWRPFDQFNSFLLIFSQMFFSCCRQTKYLQFMKNGSNGFQSLWNSMGFMVCSYHSGHLTWLYK